MAGSKHRHRRARRSLDQRIERAHSDVSLIGYTFHLAPTRALSTRGKPIEG
jgi:hypothetical protein